MTTATMTPKRMCRPDSFTPAAAFVRLLSRLVVLLVVIILPL
jgi:hypothetical protein